MAIARLISACANCSTCGPSIFMTAWIASTIIIRVGKRYRTNDWENRVAPLFPNVLETCNQEWDYLECEICGLLLEPGAQLKDEITKTHGCIVIHVLENRNDGLKIFRTLYINFITSVIFGSFPSRMGRLSGWRSSFWKLLSADFWIPLSLFLIRSRTRST